MSKYLILLFIAVFSLNTIAQETSDEFIVYDVIFLKDGGSIKGEILSFDEPSGGMVFKDNTGKTYSFSREDYDYFQENQSFPIKEKDFVLRERKNGDFCLQVGFSLSSLVYRPDFSNNPIIPYTNDYQEIPICLKVSAGKYFDEKNFGGVTFEYDIASGAQSYYSGGLRYSHYYDSRKSNLGLYIPVEFQFSSITGQSFIQVFDTTNAQSSFYPDPVAEYQSLTLSLGHGFTAVMSDKKYLSFELALLTQFGLKEEYTSTIEIIPASGFKGSGFKAALIFGF